MLFVSLNNVFFKGSLSFTYWIILTGIFSEINLPLIYQSTEGVALVKANAELASSAATNVFIEKSFLHLMLLQISCQFLNGL
ncbi:hypothetical protein [Pelagibaculum spongiae]|uniref:Uncharacterized protein n=1 Tax=Pelagibaculum spongiae TaxID=2080658 RepID=A0A2V1GRV5_9GAMM|nr:hypothetical protein [Pelagibaculum spongiae]PVZ67731.1 hypothetical protein DC094_14960 [Pelagibaculum spongiae]